jgi:transposase
MQGVTTIGLDIAKSAFQVHGVDALGKVVTRYAKIHGTKHRPWLTALLARRPPKVAAIALANKIARIAWAMMAKGAC